MSGMFVIADRKTTLRLFLKKLKIKKTVETFPKIQRIILGQSPIHLTTRFLINIISYVKDKRNQAMLSITSVTIKCSLNPAEISLKKMCQFNWLYTGPGEGNGTRLQYSCLENPTDRGAWQAAAHGVTKSRTRPSDFTFTFHFHPLEREMATHSSVLTWRIPGTGEPGGLPSMGLHRVGHD